VFGRPACFRRQGGGERSCGSYLCGKWDIKFEAGTQCTPLNPLPVDIVAGMDAQSVGADVLVTVQSVAG
jgi:hypothetical protein